jgi:DNA repair protein RecN (Recombination protein N)
MLNNLKISNFILIDELFLDFNAGLTIVTGETGSGKSIIIDALLLLFGGKCSNQDIRPNCTRLSIEAQFILSNQNAVEWLRENDLLDPEHNTQLICRRVVEIDAKSRNYINGNGVTLTQMRALGELLMDIHTQHASISLIKPETQRTLLDTYAKLTKEVTKLSNIYNLLQKLTSQIKIQTSQNTQLEEQRKYYREKVDELNLLKLHPNEWEELETEQKKLTHATEVLQELNSSLELLSTRDISLISNIHKLKLSLNKISAHMATLDKALHLLNTIEIEIHELVHELNIIARNIEENPEKLLLTETRIRNIFEVSRKYKLQPNQIPEDLIHSKNELDRLNLDLNTTHLQEIYEKTQQKYQNQASIITAARTTMAKVLSNNVTKLLHKLGIDGKFEIALTTLTRPTSYGLENIEYQIKFNQGSIMQPMARAASGGELSRTALALYLLRSVNNSPEVIIFDEIDVGIGGKISAMVGQMLQELSIHKQIICITHQPQTASFGNTHLHVNKKSINSLTKIDVQYLDNDARIAEIARMLGGIEITPTGIRHAKEMLKNSKTKGYSPYDTSKNHGTN